MATLVDYLSNLNSAETQWGLWVNPQNIDEYRVGQYCFENGGLRDGWVCVGNLENLSYGFQSNVEAIEHYLKDLNGRIEYNGRNVCVNIQKIVDAYTNGNLDEDFQAFLEEESEAIKGDWAKTAAELKAEELKGYFAPGGEWEKEQAQAEAEAESWQQELDRQAQYC